MAKLKYADLAKKHNVQQYLKLDEKTGGITVDDKLYEELLKDTDLTLDQVKKLQKHDAEVLGMVTYAGGELAHKAFKTNPELTETSLTYSAGHNKVHAYYAREGENKTRNIVETHGVGDGGELAKVYKALDKMFEDLNK